MNRFKDKKGFSQIVLLVIISFMAIALPIATKLVQNIQENRSSATQLCSCSGVNYSASTEYNCIRGGGTWTCSDSPTATGVLACTNGAYKCVNTAQYKCIGTSWTFWKSCSNGCSGTSCKVTNSTYYYYEGSTKTCKPTTSYASLSGCIGALGACWEYESGCKSAKGLYTTYYYYDEAAGSCESTNSYASLASCSSTKTKCYEDGDTCESDNGIDPTDCKVLPSLTLVKSGESKCINFTGGIFGSQMVKCTNGKLSTINYSGKDCTCNLSLDLKLTGVSEGAYQCVKIVSGIFIRSRMYKCTSGVLTVKNFSDANCSIEATDGGVTLYYGSSCTEGVFINKDDCLGTGYACFEDKDDCFDYYGLKYTIYSNYGGKCDSSTGNWQCVQISSPTSDVDGIYTFSDKSSCQNADGCSKDGEEDTCTSDEEGYTQCTYKKWPASETCPGDSGSIRKCVSGKWVDEGDGCYYGCTDNGDGKASCNTSCSGSSTSSSGSGDYGSSSLTSTSTPTPTPTSVDSTSKVSLKFAFDGVSPDLSCLDNFGTVTVTVGQVGTTVSQDLSVSVSNIGSTNSQGYAIFEADNVALDSKFNGLSNIYIKIKGQVHLKMYYCTKGQSAKSSSQVCNLVIDGTVNDFSEYPILAGDVDQDGAVTVLDFAKIKSELFNTGCGYTTDLNGDAIINNFDVKLFKEALKEKYDE